jgi:hypothetical protein
LTTSFLFHFFRPNFFSCVACRGNCKAYTIPSSWTPSKPSLCLRDSYECCDKKMWAKWLCTLLISDTYAALNGEEIHVRPKCALLKHTVDMALIDQKLEVWKFGGERGNAVSAYARKTLTHRADKPSHPMDSNYIPRKWGARITDLRDCILRSKRTDTRIRSVNLNCLYRPQNQRLLNLALTVRPVGTVTNHIVAETNQAPVFVHFTYFRLFVQAKAGGGLLNSSVVSHVYQYSSVCFQSCGTNIRLMLFLFCFKFHFVVCRWVRQYYL